MAGYPLFQSALSSNPFPGTMAETSTPKPTDATAQMESPYVSPPDEQLQANEAADEAERRERIAFLKQQKQIKLKEIEHVKNLKWSKHPQSNRWVRRQLLGLNGNKDVEPPEMMYERLKFIERLSGDVMAMQEQIRLESQLGPYQTAYRSEKGQDQANQEDIQANLVRWRAANDVLVKAGMEPLPEDTIQSLAQNPTASTRGRYGENDPIKRGTDAAGLGAAAGPGAADDPTIPEPLRNLVRLGAGQRDKVAKEKGDDDSAPLPVLGLYKQPKDLHAEMHKDFKDLLNTDGYFHWEKYKVKDPLTGMETERERKAWSKEEIKQARVAVATRYPGYEKYFPNFVEKGFTDVPNTAADGEQKDVQTQAARARARAVLQGK